MKHMRKIMVWIVPSVVIAVGVGYRFVLQPRFAVNQAIKNQETSLEQLDSSLQKSVELLQNLSAPNTIMIAKKGATDYVTRLNKAGGTLTLGSIGLQPIVESNYNSRVRNFNLFVENTSYREAVIYASDVVFSNKAFLAHHGGVMLALVNLLEYNAADDMSPTNPDALRLRLDEAQAGLDKTVVRLKAAPAYTNDPTLNQLINQIQALQAVRDAAESSLESTSFPPNKESFVVAVEQVQKNIIANRNLFWTTESSRQIKDTNEAQQLIKPYFSKLKSI